MRAVIVVMSIVMIGLAALMLTSGAEAQEPVAKEKQAAVYTCPMHPAVKSAEAGKCPKCGMALVKAGPQTTAKPLAGNKQDMMPCCMVMMQKANLDPAMMQRCQVMMQTPIFLDSPCAVYGQAASLGLSEEQKAKLMEIENEARKKALAVLTPEQQQKMGEIPDKPMPMTQMCQQMCGKMTPKMRKMMGGKGMDGSMMMCPMMPGMKSSAKVKAPETKATK